MGCEILDWQCILVSEIFGSATLAIVMGLLFYFIAASRLRLGFDTTFLLAIPLSLMIGLAIGGFSVVYAIAAFIAAIIIAWMFQRIFGNR